MRDLIGQELERDEAVQASVFGFVDHTHPAAAELSENAVMRNRRADHAGLTPKKMSDDRVRVKWRSNTSEKQSS